MMIINPIDLKNSQILTQEIEIFYRNFIDFPKSQRRDLGKELRKFRTELLVISSADNGVADDLRKLAEICRKLTAKSPPPHFINESAIKEGWECIERIQKFLKNFNQAQTK